MNHPVNGPYDEGGVPIERVEEEVHNEFSRELLRMRLNWEWDGTVTTEVENKRKQVSRTVESFYLLIQQVVQTKERQRG